MKSATRRIGSSTAALCIWMALDGCAPTPADPVPPSPPRTDRGRPATPAPPTGRTLRFISLAIRDAPPSLEETDRFLSGETSLDTFVAEWLESPKHEERVRRYFSDFFGIAVGFTPFDSFLLEKNGSGVYRLRQKPDCTLAEAVSRPAWWLNEGETILICPTSTSDAFRYPSTDPVVMAECAGADPLLTNNGCHVLCSASANQAGDPRCGCGPEQLLCMPCERTGARSSACDPASARNRELEHALDLEPVERGLHVYRNGLSWFDYLGGNFFYGPRALYLYYLHGQGQLMTTALSAETAIAQLRTIPLNGATTAAWPAGFERAGVVTSPGYLNTYNTFRGRARALSLKLLCHDVDQRLNTDRFEGYPNPTFTAADRDHGSDQRCSYCHYGLDNQASMLFGYHPDGAAQYDYDPLPSQEGHVFGQDLAGPAALVRGYVERGPGFDECMAKRTWTSFTGLSWEETLSDPDRAGFLEMSRKGPRALIRAILTSPVLRMGTPP